MKITTRLGKKCEGDKIYSITSNGVEDFALDRLLVLINQIGLNEKRILESNKEKGWRDLFTPAIMDSVNLAKEGIDLFNEDIMKDFCKRNHIQYTKMKQTVMKEFF